MNIKLLKHQMVYAKTTKPITMLIGGRGVGKSFIGGHDTVRLLTQGKSILVCAPTIQQLKDTIFKAIIDALIMHKIPYKYNKTEKKIFCLGQIIYGSSNEAFEKARGITGVSVLIIDEAALCCEEALQIWSACLRGQVDKDGFPIPPEIKIITTPKGKRNWVYQYSKRDDCLCIFAASRDNNKLSEFYHKQMESMYGGKFAEQELKGGFVDFDGDYYNTDKIKIIGSNDQINVKSFCIAFDLAYSKVDKKASKSKNKKKDYSAAALCCQTVDNKFIILEVERWQQEIGLTKQIVDRFIKKCKVYGHGIPAYIEANGAQSAVYQSFRDSGISVYPAPFSHISKSNRMFAHANDMELGNICISEEVELKDDIITEYKEFSMDDSHAHDDMIDAINYCSLHFNKGVVKRLNIDI